MLGVLFHIDCVVCIDCAVCIGCVVLNVLIVIVCIDCVVQAESARCFCSILQMLLLNSLPDVVAQ